MLCTVWPLDGSVLLQKEFRQAASVNSVVFVAQTILNITSDVRKPSGNSWHRLHQDGKTLFSNTSKLQNKEEEKSSPFWCFVVHDSWIQDSVWTEWLCLLARRMQSRPGPLRHVTPTPPMTGRFTRRRAEVKVCQTNKLLFGSAELLRVSSLIRAQSRGKTKRRVSWSRSECGEPRWDEGLFEAKASFQVMAHLHFPPSLLDLDHWRCETPWVSEKLQLPPAILFYYLFFSIFFFGHQLYKSAAPRTHLSRCNGYCGVHWKNISHLIWQAIWARFLRENCLLKCWHLLMKHKPFVLSFSVSNWAFLHLTARWDTKKIRRLQAFCWLKEGKKKPQSVISLEREHLLCCWLNETWCVLLLSKTTYTHMHRHTPPVNQWVQTLDFFFRLNSLFSLL